LSGRISADARQRRHATERRKAVAHLRKADPALGAVIDKVGRCEWEGATAHTHFGYLLRCIVYQQLSGKAAATIFGRVQALYAGRLPTPRDILSTPVRKLRAAGLSGRKAEYARELATRVAKGELPLESLHAMSDDQVIDTLVQVKGIGRWTAQMVLMFHLGRPDVFPELDLGIQKGVQKLLGARKLPSPVKTAKAGEKWAPFRTVAAWYLWRSLDVE
jgi:3-methyladenine DNA glycosylase/8-oxoguanine DNA glycosylase